MFIPKIIQDKCSRCRECAKICPKLVFATQDDDVTVEDPSQCTGCEACCAVCPNEAILVEDM